MVTFITKNTVEKLDRLECMSQLSPCYAMSVKFQYVKMIVGYGVTLELIQIYVQNIYM